MTVHTANPETLKSVLSELLPGDTLLLRGGLYHQHVLFNKSGLAGAWISIKPYESEPVTFSGEGLAAERKGLIQLQRVSYVELKGIVVQHAPFAGIWANECAHVTIAGCKTTHTQSSGIHARHSNAVLILDNEVRMARLEGGTGHEWITVALTNGFEIIGNHLLEPSRLHSIGIDAKNGSHNGVIADNIVDGMTGSGIYVDGYELGCSHIDVYGNTVLGCSHNINVSSEQGGLVEKIRIFDNDVDGRGESITGIMLTAYGLKTGTIGPMQDIEIFSNVVRGCNKFGIRVARSNLSGPVYIYDNNSYDNAEDVSIYEGNQEYVFFSPPGGDDVTVEPQEGSAIDRLEALQAQLEVEKTNSAQLLEQMALLTVELTGFQFPDYEALIAEVEAIKSQLAG